MSIFLDCFKNNGIDYLRIVDGRRIKKEDGKISNKRITIKNLGALRNFDDKKGEGLLQRVRQKFKDKTLDIGISYEELYKKDISEKIVIKNPVQYFEPKNIGYFFIENIFNKLGINDMINRYKSDNNLEYDILGLVKLLIYGRILSPESKKRTFEHKERYLFPVTTCNDINDVYKVLDVLNEKSKSIQLRMNTKIKNSSIGRKTDLTYYDVTNYYFETMYGDDDTYELDEEGNIKLDKKGKPIILETGIRKRGVSKENRKEPIVQMGLLIDNNGIPVSYKIFPGNTQDKTTFKNILENDITDMSLGKIVVVADNGMNTQENKYLITEQNNEYIVSKSVKKSWTKLRDWALCDEDYIIQTNSNKTVTFKYKSRINDVILTYTDKDGKKSTKTIKEKEIIYWSKKHYEKEVYEHKKFIEYLESCKENPDKLKDKEKKSKEFIKIVDVDKETGEIIKPEKVVVFLEQKLERYKETMGYYSIVTSDIEADDKEVINRYHGLSRIEDSFRVIKSDLEGRPIYVWTKEHINAHFLICFIALTVIRIMQYKVLKMEGKETINVDGWQQGITAENLSKALKDYQANHIGDGYYQISNIDNNMDKLLKIYNQDLNAFPNISNISSYKNKIVSKEL